MSKRKTEKTADALSTSADDVDVELERVGVFMNQWKVVKSYGPSSMNSHITSYRAGQLIWDEELIMQLLDQGAPLRVYIHDVTIASCSN